MIRLLQRQGFIEHKPTSASEAAHQQRLLPVGYQFKLVSLQALHDGSLYCVLHHDAIGHVYPGPEVTINVPAARKRSFLILRTRFARGGEFARFSGLEEDKKNGILPFSERRRSRHVRRLGKTAYSNVLENELDSGALPNSTGAWHARLPLFG